MSESPPDGRGKRGPRCIVRVATATGGALCVCLAAAAAVLLIWYGRMLWVAEVQALGRHVSGMAVLALALAAAGISAYKRYDMGAVLMLPSARQFGLAGFALALVSAIAVHYAWHKGVPDIPDEFSYLHQARTFADGALYAPSPALEEFYYVSWGTHDHGKWFVAFPPGYALHLAIGSLIGAEGLVNPLLSALLVLVLYALAREMFADSGGDGAAARMAVVLYVISPFRLMHAGSFMAHPCAALYTALAILGTLRGLREHREPRRAYLWAAVAGGALAMLGATRPLDAVLVGSLLLVPVAYALWVRPRRVGPRLLVALAALAPIAGAYGAYNAVLTGNPATLPVERYIALTEEQSDCFRLGFGPGIGNCRISQNSYFGAKGFSFANAVTNTRKRLSSYAKDLLGLVPLALLPIAGLFLGVFAGPRQLARRLWLGLLVGGFVAVYGLFFYHGVAYGARFFYSTLPVACVLAGAVFAPWGRETGSSAAVSTGRRRVGRVRAGLARMAVPVLILASAASIDHARRAVGNRGRTQGGQILQALDRPDLGDAVVFVPSRLITGAARRHPAAVAANRPLIVVDLGDAANAGFMRAHPGRRPMRFDFRDRSISECAYAVNAPVRHEAGAMYPLQESMGGFGRRVSAKDARVPALSGFRALGFSADQPEAWFAIPIWVPADDAGAMTIHVETVSHPAGPEFGVAIAEQPVSVWFDTYSKHPTMRSFAVHAQLSAGKHWLRIHLRDAGNARRRSFFLDFVELRGRD